MMFTEPIVIAASCTSQTKPASCGCYAALRIMRTRVFPSVHLEDVILSCLLTRCSRHSLHSCALMRSNILICPSYAMGFTPAHSYLPLLSSSIYFVAHQTANGTFHVNPQSSRLWTMLERYMISSHIGGECGTRPSSAYTH